MVLISETFIRTEMRERGCTVKAWPERRCNLPQVDFLPPPHAGEISAYLKITESGHLSLFKQTIFQFGLILFMTKLRSQYFNKRFPWWLAPSWSMGTTKCHWWNKAWIWDEWHSYLSPSQFCAKFGKQVNSKKTRKAGLKKCSGPNFSWILLQLLVSAHGSRFLPWQSQKFL